MYTHGASPRAVLPALHRNTPQNIDLHPDLTDYLKVQHSLFGLRIESRQHAGATDTPDGSVPGGTAKSKNAGNLLLQE